MTRNASLFSLEQLPTISRLPDKDFKSLRYPLWTHNKPKLIQEYLRLFEFVTHHGVYIDGFAAPQSSSNLDTWAAKLVLEIQPKWFREFWLCDIDPIGITKLLELKSTSEDVGRSIEIVPGNFNETIYDILCSGKITESKATFALLDQRTFECEWRTVVALSRHKKKTKIELFYFLATGWIDRSFAAVKAEATIGRIDRWWGGPGWRDLQGMNGTIRAQIVAKRFEGELGYGKATVYPIHNARCGGRIMYHMIHATDHPDAPPLMVRAYRKVSGRSDLEPKEIQSDFEAIWKKIDADED